MTSDPGAAHCQPHEKTPRFLGAELERFRVLRLGTAARGTLPDVAPGARRKVGLGFIRDPSQRQAGQRTATRSVWTHLEETRREETRTLCDVRTDTDCA